MSDGKARDKGGIAINLMGKEFRVACPEGEEARLHASVSSVAVLGRELEAPVPGSVQGPRAATDPDAAAAAVPAAAPTPA